MNAGDVLDRFVDAGDVPDGLEKRGVAVGVEGEALEDVIRLDRAVCRTREDGDRSLVEDSYSQGDAGHIAVVIGGFDCDVLKAGSSPSNHWILVDR